MKREREWREAQLRKAWDAVRSVRRFGETAAGQPLARDTADGWRPFPPAEAATPRTLH